MQSDKQVTVAWYGTKGAKGKFALPIIAGVDWRDAGVIPMPLGAPGDVAVEGLREAFYTDDGVASPDARTVEVLKNCVAVMRDAGMKVDEALPALIEDVDGAEGSPLGVQAGGDGRRRRGRSRSRFATCSTSISGGTKRWRRIAAPG